MGLAGAGKTTLIRHVLEGKELEELESLAPTEGVKTDEFRYRRLVEISTFDCGGQKQFLEGYFTESLERTIFTNVRVFFWVVDAANQKRLNDSRTWFKRAYNSLKLYSPKAKIIVLVHKYDLKGRITKDKLKKYFIEEEPLPGWTFVTSSVKTKSARTILCKVFNKLIEKTETERMKNLQKVLDKLNNKLNSIVTMLINKDDGLEIASALSPELESKLITKEASEFLQYLSIKTLIYPLNIAQKLVTEFRNKKFLESKKLNATTFQFDAEYLIIKDIHKYISLFLATPVRNVSISKIESEISKAAPKLLEILKIN